MGLFKIKRLVSTYQEILVWLPPALLALFITFKLIPILDPRSGIDGFGQLYAMLLNIVGGILVCFSAWLTKRCYLGVTSDEDVLQLQTFLVNDKIDTPTKRVLLGVKALDLLEWILCVWFWGWVIFH